MGSRRVVLREVMLSTGITQSELARMSGVYQPTISRFLSGHIELSDEQLDRLLSCLGFRLEVVRRAVESNLTHSERRSWSLHRSISGRLTKSSLEEWLPTIEKNLDRLRGGVQGEPHRQNIERWLTLIADRDTNGLKRVMTGVDRQSIEMREVSPMSGILSQDERLSVLAEVS